MRSDVVGEFVYIHIAVANLLIDGIVGGIEREVVPLLEIGLVAFLLHIARVGTHLELVHLVGVDGSVGKGEVLVVWLTHIDDAHVISIDEMDGWLVCLSVDVDA